MTLQWTFVAVFLYLEVFVLILLMLPWIRAHFWSKIFRSRLVKRLEGYSHVYSWGFAGILLLLFFDAIREVRKYSYSDKMAEASMHTPNADAVIHMRLFRAQRNLYISGFALFLYFVIKRMVYLLTREAQLQASAEAAMKQAQNASETAQKLMDADGGGDGGDSKQVAVLKETIDELKTQVEKAERDRDAIKNQAKNLQTEYDRLADELNAAQKAGGDKKGD